MFESFLVKCHIRALYCHTPYLFIGRGHILDVERYDIDKRQLIVSQPIFNGFNINGIIVEELSKKNNDLILVLFGNRFLSIYKFSPDNKTLCQMCVGHNFNDWVMGVCIKENIVFVVLAHNEVAIFDWTINQVLTVKKCPDTCILYSAHFLETYVSNISKNSSLTGAKTDVSDDSSLSGETHVSTGETHVSNVSNDSPLSSETHVSNVSTNFSTHFSLAGGTVFKEIVIWSCFDDTINCHQKIKGHDGVIFAIDYNKDMNVLASASDDRSIRIWTNDDHDDSKSLKTFNFTLKHALYSHEARIWKVRILSAFETLISVGEDSAICFWNINKGTLIQKEKVLKNVNIWSLAVDNNNDFLFTGGSDSYVMQWNIKDILEQTKVEMCLNLDGHKMTRVITFLNNVNQKPHFFISYSDGKSSIMMSQSDSESSTVMSQSDDKYSTVMSQSDDKSSTVMSQSVDYVFDTTFENVCAFCNNDQRDIIILGDKFGTCAMINFKSDDTPSIMKKKLHSGKIFSLCFINNCNFLSCGSNGELKLWDLNLKLIGQFNLPMSRHQWHTCGVMLNELLILGDRCGSLYVYENNCQDFTQYFHNIHGHNGVTCVQVKPNTNFFYSGGRNGRIFEYLLKDKLCIWMRVFKIFTNMEWITKLFFNHVNGELEHVIGFSGRNFDVWHERESRFIWTLECGGGHRLWDFTIYNHYLYYIYNKQDQILCVKNKCSTQFNKFSNENILHFIPKKINSCSILFNTNINYKSYFALGGEDNQVFIICFNYPQARTYIQLILYGHISNISGIDSCLTQSHNICYLVSVGGRSQLIIWKLETDENYEKLFCQQVVCNYLWSNNNSEKPWKNLELSNNNRSNDDPQIRYINVKIKNHFSNEYLICASCSDSAIRIFFFTQGKYTISLLRLINFQNNCIFNFEYLNALKIIIGSDNGVLRVIFPNNYHHVQESEFLIHDFQSTSHQSGINSIDVHYLRENIWLIATGGDDNKLTLDVIEISNDKFIQISSCENSTAHISQITGLKIISHNLIISASIDQRIFLWQYSCDVNFNLNLIPHKFYISCIADATCMKLLRIDNQILMIMCGEGCEIIKCSAFI